jgi:hypothetical protein
MTLTTTLKIAGGAAIFALSFFVTLYLMDIYAPERVAKQAPTESVTLKPPFQPISGSKFAFIASADSFNHLTDTPTEPERSPFMLYENDKKLGPPHSSYNSVVQTGEGRFIHWIHHGFIFSASDNSNPNTNGRSYRVTRIP